MAEIACCSFSMNLEISSIRTDSNAVIVVFDVESTKVSFQKTLSDLRRQVFNENSQLRKCFPKLDLDFGVKESYFLQFGKISDKLVPQSESRSQIFSFPWRCIRLFWPAVLFLELNIGIRTSEWTRTGVCYRWTYARTTFPFDGNNPVRTKWLREKKLPISQKFAWEPPPLLCQWNEIITAQRPGFVLSSPGLSLPW